MTHFILLVFVIVNLYSADSKLIDCDKVFEARKDEMLRELERIEHRQEEFEALQEATNSFMNQKKKKILANMNELNATLQKVENTKKDVLDLYEKNKKLLEDINNIKDNKISETYLKMKDKKAAAILDKMPKVEAANILFHLTAKKISKIMARMDPVIASSVTLILKKGPPFDKNVTQ